MELINLMAAFRMNNINIVSHQHIPVLLTEVVHHLVISPEGTYVDATFGRGSHAEAILNSLNSHGRLIALDKDPEAVAYAKHRFSHDRRFTIFHTSYAALERILTQLNLLGQVQGLLLDLGVSSPQLDDPKRGFSFTQNGVLDMRMDTTQGEDAEKWLAEVDEKTLASVLWQYGEEKKSKRIARAIIAARSAMRITTTGQLADIISHAVPRSKKSNDKHPATRSFQAIRIVINQELAELQQVLMQGLTSLAIGGRLAVISFHSLEDRIVKQFIAEHEKGKALPRGLPIKESHFMARLKTIGKIIKPSSQEIFHNPRARSAILRIAEKLL
jgi:16S rRNA (cytosine1402-N4)-methyltransferase